MLPFVSIVIPCYNESEHIGACLDSILSSSYPLNLLEILVVDGRSLDNTRDIVGAFASKHPCVKLIDNPHRLKPHALNIGITAAKGDIIIRMDAHALYDRSYISKSVHYLDEYKADNVGGIRKTLPSRPGLVARSIAFVFSSKFGGGDATFRTGAKSYKWVDTVFGGCYRRQTFQKIGLFNEALVRGQDREFNVRLQNSGGKILFAPDITCYYYARGDLGSYIPWIYSAGLTPFFVSRLIKRRIYSWRNVVPLSFLFSLVILPVLSVWHPVFRWLLGTEIITYLFCSFAAAILAGEKKPSVKFISIMPFIFFLTHTVYGVGSFVGLCKRTKGAGEWTRV